MKKVFINNLQMETQTVFTENGNINIYPCGFELGKHIVSGGVEASQKGRMVTEENGTSRFTPYAEGSGSRYHTLFRTPHGEVKESGSTVIFQLRFPKRLGKRLIESLYDEEISEMQAFIKTRREETLW